MNSKLKKLLTLCNSKKATIIKYNSRKLRALVESEQGVKYKASYSEVTERWYFD